MVGAAVEIVGRRRERDALADAARSLDAGRGSLVLIRGESGVGKTRLLRFLADLATAPQQLFTASARRLEAGMPFRVVAQALGCEPTSDDPELASIAQRLRARDDAGQTVPFDTVPELRAEALDRLVDHVVRCCTVSPVVLVLDDLQWADLDSLAVLDVLTGRLAELPLLIALAHQQAVPDPDVAAALGELGVTGTVLELEGLDTAEVDELVTNVVGAPPAASLRATLDGAGGNPLLLLESLSALDGADALAPAGDAIELASDHPATPPADALLARVRSLGPEVAELMTLAAVMGSTTTIAELAAVSERPITDVIAAVREARAHGVVADEGDHIAFRHELVRSAVDAQLGDAEKSAIAATAARVLVTMDAPPERVAPHLIAAPDGTVADTAARLLAAARRVRSSPRLAISYGERALATCPDDELLRARIVEELATAHCWAGQPEPASHLVRVQLARLGETSPDRTPTAHRDQAPTAAIDADEGPPPQSSPPTHADPADHDASPYAAARRRIPALRRVLARALTLQGHAAEAADALDPLDADVDDPREERHLRIDGAFARLIALDVHGATATVRALGAQTDDPLVVSATAAIESWYATLQGHGPTAVAAGRDAVLAAEGDPLAYRYRPWLVLAQAHFVNDEVEETLTSLARDRELSNEHGAAWGTAVAHSVTAGLHLRTGRWDDTVAQAYEGLRWASDHRTRLGVPWLHAYLAQVALRRGDTEAAAGHLADAEAELAGGARMGLDGVWWTRGLLAEHADDLGGAVEALGGLWDLLIGTGFTARCSLVGPDLVRVTRARGDTERAAEVTDRLEALVATCDTGSARAAALRARGMTTDDVALLDEAVDIYRDVASPVMASWTAGEAALAAARVGDTDDATTRAREVVGEVGTRGATGEADLLVRQLRAHGVRLRRRRRASAPSVGWEALTDTEWSVARLAAEGLTNRDVAERLHMSPRTVESHLTHIFRKVGVTSRVELAVAVSTRLAEEPGLGAGGETTPAG
ncbi:MAG: AAA family ATPase [Acidimicrobiia bacterium]|nr:AAA family ATPase [Acidimicrobiia bacterium]